MSSCRPASARFADIAKLDAILKTSKPFWSARRADQILARAREFVGQHCRDRSQGELLALALQGLPPQLLEMGFPAPFMALPLLVYAAVRNEEKPAFPLAVATTLLYLGVDILDDLADGDLPAHWKGRKESEINCGLQISDCGF